MPGQICFQGTWYRRRSKTPNRKVATLFGTITLWRMLYQPLHGIEPSIFPLEIRLGLEAGLATPGVAERVAQAAITFPQKTVLTLLKDTHGVSWSVASLRKVIAGVAAGVEGHRHDAQAARLLSWLEQADRSSGGRKPVLAVGRDGLMLPIRDQGCYREGATATISVYDRRGQRLGTVYLGRTPESGQATLSGQLTALIEAVLRGWTGPTPRLAYITDGGYHQTRYYRRVLRRMSDPHRPGRRLKWQWVIDYYHASEYISKLAEALFPDAREGSSWARKMGRWLKEKPQGIYRVLHSAAAIRRRRIIVSATKREQYRTAYAYLRKRMRWLDYRGYRRDHLPIGSGVTEAACKTVFTQRLKQSGMTWKAEGGQRIVDLRRDPLEWGLERGVSILPGVEADTRNGDSRDDSEEKDLKGRIIAGTGATASPTTTRAYHCSNASGVELLHSGNRHLRIWKHPRNDSRSVSSPTVAAASNISARMTK